MPSVIGLGDVKPKKVRLPKAPKATPSINDCKCGTNSRTKRPYKACYVGKSKTNPSGWRFSNAAEASAGCSLSGRRR